jgi:sulfur-oxidizing protein SoxY
VSVALPLRGAVSAATALLCVASAAAAEAAGGNASPVDPLNSPSWESMRARFFSSAPVVFDERVRVIAPRTADNPLAVPVLIDASALGAVQEMLVVADLNPIPRILSYRPTRATADLAFRFKVEQSTPIRAAVRLQDGSWHLGGIWLSAAGGGCTAPSRGSSGFWQGHLLETKARLWERPDTHSERLRLRLVHPMDTGLASGIPAFYVDEISVRDAQGTELAALQTYEPIAENPVISFDLQHEGAVRVEGRDIQGNHFAAVVAP